MRLTGLLLVVFLLSLFLVTDARLRFKDETTSCENEADFECEPGVCINATLKCNSAYDCESLADESVLLCGCPSGEFRCQNSCIPLQQRCDGECNCAVNCADEENCNSFHCLPGFQKCKNGLCHPTYVWCDFYNDCGDMSDEANCERPDCWFTEYQCDNKQCINSFFVCDGIEDCADGSDEGNSTCSEDKFADCGDGTRVHKHNFCDGMADCPLNEADESNCQCKAKAEFQCNNSKCLPRAKKCDRRCDCLDCEDEDGCENKDNCDTDDHFFCPMIKEWEHMLPVCLRKEFICDGYGDCDKTEADELCFDGEGPPDCSAKGLIGCGAGDPRCLPPFTKCDKTLHCLGGFDEKQNCSAPSPCQPGQFRCRRGGRCFNETIRCDTYTDCFDGSDEEDCESFVCPADTWKCAAGHCIPYSFLCDFRLDCYYHKNGTKDISDETSCSTSHYIRPSSTERGRSVGFVKVGDRSCEEDEWQCRSGQCIEAWRRCFAHSDDEFGGCADKSHLRNCSDFVCPDGSFKCARSHCIESSQVCDRKINCIESWDDETQDLNDCTQECSSSGCNCSHFDMHCSNLGLHGSTFNINAQDTRLIKHFYLEGNSMGYLLEDGNALSGLTRMILL
ncbi:G-protein coupled receptor GRL101-like [Acanthaster planci]|uniref:G-protein coupled receptor GRL101-like n=1 Tax=Acanthaster planci TaxID=133434 RepID=A0A8B7YF33_ACAPL|nr:G-protein coupled receptor GRL101-like [Acanthaster planci]XP_022091202.1 G-protein coupled receptor GRL101-like [Acanthaster planci]XP_022091203.1 G-protein coupled receptor GRL101-like [Acanthaster planci]XP_022091204.1 G-protein coupled receptor GRL101-like [Acanthaster planci]XP_022091205.1 G-protein coupled receptor GRL101-like [Acanthaster planci]